LKNIIFLTLWAVIGAGMAFLILKSQWWSVQVIHPAEPQKSKRLIIGGAVIRWIIITIMFAAASNFSMLALFVVFISFMVSRLLILNLWEKNFNTDQGNIH
jgi:hypothetical protein